MTAPRTDATSPSGGAVTLSDVARRADVSAMTVSRVVNDRAGVSDATRERVRAAVRELGYRPNRLARGLKANRTATVGLLVPDITNPYFPEIVRGVEDVALEHGYTVFLTNVIEDPERETATLRVLEERRVDGVVVCSPRLADDALLQRLERHPASVVVDRDVPSDLAGSVRVDHERGARLAADHLVAQGCRRIGLIAGPRASRAGAIRRRTGFAALAEHGLEPPPEWVIDCPPYVSGGREGARRLLDIAPDVDGILCYNDLVAAGALRTLAAAGRRVPHDVAVTGYDDIAFAEMFTPPLTTLHVPTYDLGINAMRMLLDRMEGRNRHAAILLRPELRIRASTRRPEPRSSERGVA